MPRRGRDLRFRSCRRRHQLDARRKGYGSGRGDSLPARVYTKAHSGPAYLSVGLALANNWFTTDRIALGDQLSASFVHRPELRRAS